MIKEIICQFLRESANKIERDECNLSDQEIETLAGQIIHIRLTKTEAAEYLGISTRTFDRKICEGKQPMGRKDRGSNQLYWYKDELKV